MARIALWVLIAVVLVGGVGLFAFIPLTVLALRSRSLRDALLAAGSLAFSVLGGVMSSQYPDAAHQPWWFGVVALGMLANGIAATAWFVVCDLRRARAQAPTQPRLQPWLHAHGQAPGHVPGHVPGQVRGQGQAWQPWVGAQQGGHPLHPVDRARPVPPIPPGGASATPTVAMPPAPMPAQPDHLGQVRAELDELSDYLRKEQGS